MNITEQEYNEQVKAIATELVSESMEQACKDSPAPGIMTVDEQREAAEDLIYDSLLHETIDGHQWIIHYSYNDDVIRWSMNPDDYQDVYSNEDVGALIAEKGLDSFGTTRAYFAMYQDVNEALEQAFKDYFDDYEEEQESETDL